MHDKCVGETEEETYLPCVESGVEGVECQSDLFLHTEERNRRQKWVVA